MLELRVLTLNIRYMGPQDAGERSWDARKIPARLCIDKHNPDVVCLQEAVKRQVIDMQLSPQLLDCHGLY
jgi:endonuclease/exonuclease/phosphatase family metal-dependent hydrolase